MTKKLSRIIVSVLILSMAMFLFNCNGKVQAQSGSNNSTSQKANPESDFEAKNIDGDKAIEITKYIGVTQNVVIPAKIRGLPVTSIGNNAFINKDLSSVTFPNSITNIGEYAFSECKNLTSVTIPNSVTNIGDYAFASCYSLTSITIPNSVTSIGSFAFAFCNNLTNVTIPDSVTSIKALAFYGCKSLTKVTFQGATLAGKLALDKPIFEGDLPQKYKTGGVGTYTTATPVPSGIWDEWEPVWIKQ